MRRFRKRTSRAVASVIVFALAVVPSAECFTSARMAPGEHACCAGMKAECDVAVTASCCPTDATELPGLVATKPTADFTPVSILVAILRVPPAAESRDSHAVAAPDVSSSGPPGVPTYLFVSSFRI